MSGTSLFAQEPKVGLGAGGGHTCAKYRRTVQDRTEYVVGQMCWECFESIFSIGADNCKPLLTNNPQFNFASTPTAGEEATALWVVGGNPGQDRLQDGREGRASGEYPGEAHTFRRQGV